MVQRDDVVSASHVRGREGAGINDSQQQLESESSASVRVERGREGRVNRRLGEGADVEGRDRERRQG
eukprot:2207526-Rhodomonas_salina.1